MEEKMLKRLADQIRQTADRLKAELRQERDLNAALAELQGVADQIVDNLKSISDTAVPGSVIDFCLGAPGASIWASKTFAVPSRQNRPMVTTGVGAILVPSPDIPPGAYSVILMVIPQTVKPNDGAYFRDGWGYGIDVGMLEANRA